MRTCFNWAPHPNKYYFFFPEDLTNERFFQKPIVLLHGYEPGLRIIGQPFLVRKFNLGDKTENYSDGLEARVSFINWYFNQYCNDAEVKMLHVWGGGIIGGPFLAFHGKFHVSPAFRSFFSFFPAFHHFSLSSGCFPVFRSFSRQLSGFRSFQNQFWVFRRYFKVSRFSVTQKCHFPVSDTLFPVFRRIFSPFLPLIWCFSGFPP